MRLRATFLTAVLLVLTSYSVQAAARDTLRVLAIGNSFSADAVEQDLYGLFEADGQPVVIANLFGNSLASHEEWIRGDMPKYKYRKIEGGVKTAVKGKRFSEAFAEEKWDVITIQQVSQDSPDYGTYEPSLKWLVRYLRRNAPEGAKIMWHQTWAYETGDSHSGYLLEHYGAQSSAMFADIAEASRRVHDTYGLEVIPSGAAIENLRTGFTREGATRDGYHLSLTIGRYAASCVWFEALTGKSCVGNAYVPYTLQNEFRREAAQRAAHAAMLNPYAVTSQRSGRGQYWSDEAGFCHTDESQAASYSLPDPLVMNDGTPVTTADQWMQQRRPELLEMFRSEVYGHSAPRQEGQHYRLLSEDRNAFGGLATRKEIAIYYTADENDLYMQLLLYVPNNVEGPVPAFLLMNLSGNTSVDPDEGISDYTDEQLRNYGVYGIPARGQRQHRYPLPLILSRGYALATFYKGDADPDYDDGFRNGVQKYIYREGQSFPDPDQWGSISAWAWGMSRAVDYLETDPSVDASRIAAIGHSRGAKTALWAAAQDERIAMAISNCSGCTGAALSGRKMGQTLRAIQVTFPNWFCLNYLKYMDNEESLPVDQHELIALIAPRPVYVASATLDHGADPKGEFLGEVAAMPVYRLLGHSGLESTEFPAPQSCISGDGMAYHLREGKHDLQAWDWVHYLDFADRYLCPERPVYVK